MTGRMVPSMIFPRPLRSQSFGFGVVYEAYRVELAV